jgi:histidyl-tRNA synthetase
LKLLEVPGNILNDISKFQDPGIEEFHKLATGLGVPEKHLEFSPHLARGLDYYTGLVFEVVSKDSDLGTLCAGGRYDNLAGMFQVNAPNSANPELSGMGVAFGFERIMLLLEEKGLLQNVGLPSSVLVTFFDEFMLQDSLKIYRDLIDAGVSAEIYPDAAKLDKQLKYADKKGIPYVVICGPEEKKKKKALLKDMASAKQHSVSLKDLAKTIAKKGS